MVHMQDCVRSPVLQDVLISFPVRHFSVLHKDSFSGIDMPHARKNCDDKLL